MIYLYYAPVLSLFYYIRFGYSDGCVAELSRTGAPLFDFLTHDAIYMVRL
jgi:hypothetical protein